MPPKKVTVVPTNSIASVFATASKPKVTSTPKASVAESKQEVTLSSLDSFVSKFYASLTPYERIAHEIAVEKLGTSYDVTRTHGFQKWRAANSKAV
jgi:hypothetical protein